jgi:hypothetical protein
MLKEKPMTEKQLVFTPQEQLQIEAIVIDRDKEEALKFLIQIKNRLEGSESKACGPKGFK